MKPASFLIAFCLLITLDAPPAGADFAAGARAYDGGDYATAYAEWHALAEAGDAMAQTAIAGMYRFGEGRRVDLAAALGWYRKAARQNDMVAQMNLAEMYRSGLGTVHDRARAWLWFTIAAGLGGEWAKAQLKTLERNMTAAEMVRARGLLRRRNQKN
jgi:hypothetical protein